jgi:hypothetical protein
MCGVVSLAYHPYLLSRAMALVLYYKNKAANEAGLEKAD